MKSQDKCSVKSFGYFYFEFYLRRVCDMETFQMESGEMAATYTKNSGKLLLEKSSSVNENMMILLISMQWQSQKD